MINGLVPHAYEGELSGRVRVNGRDVSEWTADELGVEVGSVFQNPRGQFVDIDVASEIAFGCECLGLPPAEIVERVGAATTALGIRGFAGRSIVELSGGQKQSVILAAAWAMHPNVFVLDEPTASLDTSLAESCGCTSWHAYRRKGRPSSQDASWPLLVCLWAWRGRGL